MKGSVAAQDGTTTSGFAAAPTTSHPSQFSPPAPFGANEVVVDRCGGPPLPDDTMAGSAVGECSSVAEAVDGGKLTSGHTFAQKVLFSTSLISPLACGSVVAFAKDVYILEMGADIHWMGIVGAVAAIWGPACYPVAGWCMDRNCLGRWFQFEQWGRRAPWFLVHILILACCAALIYMPPSLDPRFLCLWFIVMAMVMSWTLAVLFTCVEAARAEMYPTKEERSEVEAVIKLSSGVGLSLGIAPQLVIVAGANLEVRGTASALFFGIALISLASLRIFKCARQACDPEKVESFVSEFYDLIRIPACRHLMLYRFVESILSTVATQAALYYLTLVDGLLGTERSLYIVAVGVIAGVMTLFMLPIWATFFRVRRAGMNTNVVCGVVCLLGAATPLLLLAQSILPKAWAFLLYAGLAKASLDGQTYWRCIALGWIVDEDCQACHGRRREAVFVGSISLVANIGRALAVVIVINGLAAAGLQMANCDRECEDSPSDLVATCVEVCERANIETQPAAVRVYTKGLFVGLLPVCQLICGILTMTFPICRERLERIYEGQARIYRQPSPLVGKNFTEGPSRVAEADGVAEKRLELPGEQ